MAVRPATADDIPALVSLGARFMGASPWAGKMQVDEAFLGEQLAAMIDEGCVLVSERDGAVGGAFVGVRSCMWVTGVEIGVELAWWVDPEHRGGPDGIRMAKQFETWCRERGIKLLVLSDLVINGEAPSGKLMRHLGYELVERAHMKEVS